MATLVIEKIKHQGTNSTFMGLLPIPGSNGAYYYRVSPDLKIERIPSKETAEIDINHVLRIKFFDGKVTHEMNYIADRDESFLKILSAANEFIHMDMPEQSKPTALYRYYIKEDKNKKIVENITTKSKVVAKAICLSDEQMRNVCFYFKLPAQSWTRDEMIISLVGDYGALFQRPFANNVIEDRMAIFLSDTFSTDFEFDLRSRVNKAIDMGVITHRGDMYYYGEKGIGATVEHIVLYFTNNVDAYENGLKNSVPMESEKVSVQEFNKISDADRAALEEEARGYGIKGDIKKFKDDTLMAKVAEGRAMAKSGL